MSQWSRVPVCEGGEMNPNSQHHSCLTCNLSTSGSETGSLRLMTKTLDSGPAMSLSRHLSSSSGLHWYA